MGWIRWSQRCIPKRHLQAIYGKLHCSSSIRILYMPAARQLGRAPRIERTALPDTAVLWAHPDALPADDGADVVYAGQIIIGEDTPLVLGAGLEGCWLHTGLTPDFFMNERLALSALKLES